MLSSLEADRAHIADLEAQISNLERAVAALRIEQAIAQERLDSYGYPVLTLPNEIISEIFVHFLPIYPTFPRLTGILSPTLLTHICRKWRDIALATPALWTAIALILSQGRISFERQSHISDIWVRRSRSRPLSIRIVENNNSIPEIFALILSHCERWEQLKLSLSSPYPPIQYSMPLLRHLDLSLGSFEPSVTVTFREVPLLRSVIFNHVAAANVALPWAQLSSLTLTDVYPREVLPVLRQTSNLIRCELHVLCDYHTISSGPPPDVRLPCLESFTLRNTGLRPVIEYLETLIVPALRSLRIPEASLGQNPIHSLKSFISKCGCRLQEVSITGKTSVDEDSYRTAFPSIPRLRFGDDEDSKVDSD
ncbi:hypothetical protein B0H13DRAFT_648123 [Mycena leptocephala]|nr:hypothetical protein B0H13DRAFT_648123 [Mycena leptocephala]